METVETFRGPVVSDRLGVTLIHEHIFVRNPELEVNLPDDDWDPARAIEDAVECLTGLYELGIRTIVDLTVPGLGRDVGLVAKVAERVPVNLVASTGWYTSNSLPAFFRFHGPGRTVTDPDPLVEMFVGDIRDGIGGVGPRAGMLKVVTDVEGITADVERIMVAAAAAHEETGVAITTHSHPESRNGLDQQAFLEGRDVDVGRIIIGHSGDTDDLDYLRELMDRGSTVGMDRFGMEHVLADDRRVKTLVSLLELGYGDRMVISQDAAIYSHVTPPSWRAMSAPAWRMDRISKHIVPKLLEMGVTSDEIAQMMVDNPRRLLEKAS